MWLMLQQTQPDDYVIATGETHSVREFVETAFRYVGRTIEWKGQGIDEAGHDAQTGQLLVRVNPKYFRPTEVVGYLRRLSSFDRPIERKNFFSISISRSIFLYFDRTCCWVMRRKPETNSDGNRLLRLR